MGEAINTCLTCLSTDRRLVSVQKISEILENIHYNELKGSFGGVCWECWSILVKFYKFKKRAKTAQNLLLHNIQTCEIKSLSTLSKNYINSYNHQYSFNFDPLNNNTKLKTESDIVKEEISDQIVDNLDNQSDIDEKLTEMPKNAETVYLNITQEKHEDNIQKKTQKSCKNKNVCTNNFVQVILNEKLTVINENIDNVYAETIDTKPTKHLLRKSARKYNKNGMKIKKKIKIKRNSSTRENVEDIQEKFVMVVLSEEEVIQVREEKRNHHNFKKIPYKCDSCVLGFTKEENYILHMQKKHDESIGTYTCEVCLIRFPQKLSLQSHKTKHYVCYRCKLCKYETHELWSALNHCRIKHADDMPDNIHCNQCQTVVKTPEALTQHMQTEHTLYCNECGAKFKEKRSLRRHMVRIHSILRDFICDICTKSFKTKTRLESHMVKHNTSIAKKLAYCHTCKVQYKNIYVYRNHLKSSAIHSERQYPCPECNKKFASKVYWTKHYNFYHLNKSQYNCEMCNKLFISDWRLRNHKQKHHGLSRLRDHSCNMCTKKFFTLATLKNHKLTHSDQRSYMCEDCGDTFKQRAALYTHTRLVHKGGEKKK